MVIVRLNDPCPCGSGKKYKKCCLLLAKRIQKITGSTSTRIPLQAFAEGNNVDTAIARAYYSSDTIDLLTWKITELILLKNLTEIIKAIDLCISTKFYTSALKLIYAAIDNLAYLMTNHQTVKKPDFIRWVDSFLLPLSGLNCTAKELYAARCGLLHQNTGATSNLSFDIKRIFYIYGTGEPEKGLQHVDESRRDQCRFININFLNNALYNGMLAFLEAVSKNPSLKEGLLKRCQEYFAQVGDEIG